MGLYFETFVGLFNLEIRTILVSGKFRGVVPLFKKSARKKVRYLLQQAKNADKKEGAYHPVPGIFADTFGQKLF